MNADTLVRCNACGAWVRAGARCPKCSRSLTPAQVQRVSTSQRRASDGFAEQARELAVELEAKGLVALAKEAREWSAEFATWAECPPPEEMRTPRIDAFVSWARGAYEAKKGKR